MSKTTGNRTPAAPRSSDAASMTIGGLARAAEVGVETVRYYQRRHLLAVPHSAGSVRRYPAAMIDRIRFIKRSQNLGFSLDEIRELMRLEQGGARNAVRKIAGNRLTNIREKIAALEQMERVLSELLFECEHTATASRCPIIAALNTNPKVRTLSI
jgi:MerR family transcriptional regulator, mercuric resistance operon regulatory protein